MYLCKCSVVITLFLINLTSGVEKLKNTAIDQSTVENAIDSDLCQRHLNSMLNNSALRLKFLDAGIRLPRGIFKGNLADFGNFYQCLEINENVDGSNVGGKYCSISIPLQQNSGLSDVFETEFNNFHKSIDEKVGQLLIDYGLTGIIDTRSEIINSIGNQSLRVAVCVPKSCSVPEAMQSLWPTVQYNEHFCRIPRDKPWVVADYVAGICFGLLLLLTVMSTAYDLRHTVLLKRDPKSANVLYQSCSLYTNCRRLVTYSSSPKTIECLDGIRVLAMLWIILGHTYSTQMQLSIANFVDVYSWLESVMSIWICAGPVSVDTFLTLSGILVVYSTAGKLNRWSLLKNIHLYYLNRILRMFPILAAGVLLLASWLNHVADGPQWPVFADKVDRCRTYWWANLLYVHNYVKPDFLCLEHSWYLAVDLQLHILSPLVLFWVLSGRRAAWLATTAALVMSIVASTIFNAIFQFHSNSISLRYLTDPLANKRYYQMYYMNTLTRSSTFFVGMLFGYLLFSYRGGKVRIHKTLVTIIWCVCIAVISATVYTTYPTQQADWDSVVGDVAVNSLVRPAWAAALCWIIFASHYGYAGPVNWFLSLRMWKLPSRLSYAMYIFHYPLIFITSVTSLTPFYFNHSFLIFKFFGDLTTTLIAAFLATLLIDAPFSTLIKLALSKGFKSSNETRPTKESSVDKATSNVLKTQF